MALSDIQAAERNESGIALALDILKQRFGERFSTGEALRRQHAHSTTYIPAQLPDGGDAPERREPARRQGGRCAP